MLRLGIAAVAYSSLSQACSIVRGLHQYDTFSSTKMQYRAYDRFLENASGFLESPGIFCNQEIGNSVIKPARIALLASLHCLPKTLGFWSENNVLVAVSKGMQAVKLCTNKILQFLTGGAG